MIYIKAVVKGEKDTPPLNRVFQYSDETDELIFNHSVELAKEKLGKNMKLNVNEALLLYAHHIARAIRTKKSASTIEKSGKTVLSGDQVLVGVPETLRILSFDAIVDGRREWVILKDPIPTYNYIMATE